jgi:hypothetical protein
MRAICRLLPHSLPPARFPPPSLVPVFVARRMSTSRPPLRIALLQIPVTHQKEENLRVAGALQLRLGAADCRLTHERTTPSPNHSFRYSRLRITCRSFRHVHTDISNAFSLTFCSGARLVALPECFNSPSATPPSPHLQPPHRLFHHSSFPPTSRPCDYLSLIPSQLRNAALCGLCGGRG